MADWWSVGSAKREESERDLKVADIPERPTYPPDTPKEEPATEDLNAPPPRKGKDRLKVAMGVAAVTVMGAVLVANVSSQEAPQGPASVTTEEGPEELPAAGLAPQGDTAEAGPSMEVETPQTPPEPVEPVEPVALTIEPQGKGRVGAVVEVAIVNNSDEPITLMASLILGDGRTAIVGQGTLAPGARRIEPGASAVGTIEFASSSHPAQVTLTDLSGQILAASTE